MQRRATLWIVGVFHISPTTGIEVIAGLIPIHFHIQKLNGRFHLRVYSLLANNIINFMIKGKTYESYKSSPFFIGIAYI